MLAGDSAREIRQLWIRLAVECGNLLYGFVCWVCLLSRSKMRCRFNEDKGNEYA